MKRKDITTKMVLLAYLESKDTNKFPYDILMKATGCDFKLAYSAIKRDLCKGYIDYGVSLRSVWVTAKGIEYIKINQ